jgi:DNA-binding NtrC family response regulator
VPAVNDAVETLIQRLRETQTLGHLIGRSPAFLTAIAAIPAIARSEGPVLITGETGTGKELVARAIHYLSPRADRPFVAVNCGLLTDTLLEDELFGHERGAFTDARERRTGLMAEAERGTLLLDEVDTLTPRGQIALLRVLQDSSYRPVGSSRERSADVRFIAATNTALRELVRSGAFRTDLYYRLCVFPVTLPPLRDRREDVPVLAQYFLHRYAVRRHPEPALTPSAEAALLAHDFPGNVRELENTMMRAAQLAQSGLIEATDLGLPGSAVGQPVPLPSAADVRTFRVLKKIAIETFERDYLTTLMREVRGNITRAARVAGKERRELARLLKKHGLRMSAPASATPRKITAGGNPPAPG